MSDQSIQAKQCSKHGSYVPEGRPLYFAGTDCPACNAEISRLEADERKRVALNSQIKAAQGASRIVGRYKSATFDTFEASTPAQRHALSTCVAFASDFAENAGRTLALIGPPGTGKTHLASAIGNALTGRGISVRFVTGAEVTRLVRATWKRDGATEDDAIASLVEPALLILDEVALVAPTDNEQRILFDVVDGRSRNASPIVVTSNMTWPELQAAVGERIADRLAENATVVALTGSSYRRRRA